MAHRWLSWWSWLLVVAVSVAACSGSDSRAGTKTSEGPTTTEAPAVDPASVKANELGVVPVLMYHRLTPTPKDEYDRSPDDFRAEIARLYASGYRPILARDLVAGTIDVPAGKTPVVLTFDDTSASQFGFDPGGQVSPTTAVGILLEFAASHPDFRPVATMYVNARPFRVADPAAALQDLVRRGYELGAHTLTHQNLGSVDSATVQKEIVQGVRVITSAVPEARVVTMALPFGVHPKDRALTRSGSWDGETYTFDGVFLVGSGPSPSPFSSGFDAMNIPRIRSSAADPTKPNYGSAFWLDTLDKHPDRRYVSDGDPRKVSFPAAAKAQLRPDMADRANPY